MTGKMVEHFTGESLYRDFGDLILSSARRTPYGELGDDGHKRWDAFAIRLNTKIHAGTTRAIDPASYLAARGVTVDENAQDTYSDAPQGPEISSLKFSSEGISFMNRGG